MLLWLLFACRTAVPEPWNAFDLPIQSGTIVEGTATSLVVQHNTSANPGAVAGSYAQALSDDGWSALPPTRVPGGAVLVLIMKDGKEGSISAVPKAEKVVEVHLSLE